MGFGCTKKCSKCGYEIEIMQGTGMMYPTQAEELLDEMKQGKHGKKFANAIETIKNPHADFSYELYQCKNCGELRNDMDICLIDGDPFEKHRIVVSKKHICGKCRKEMKVVTEKQMENLKCPKCGDKLVINIIMNWD